MRKKIKGLKIKGFYQGLKNKMNENVKICKMCGVKFDNNPFIYCDDCMDIDKAIINRLEKGNMERKDRKRFSKALRLLRKIK